MKKDYSQAIDHYRLLDPKGLFCVPDRFGWYNHKRSDKGEHERVLEIFLRKYDNEEDDLQRLRLQFVGVCNLSVKFEWLRNTLIVVRLIRDHQLENLNYEVVDRREDAFSFVCRTFQASLEEVVLDE